MAIVDNDIVGAVLVGSDRRRGYLQHLAVSVSHRGRRIGRDLVLQSVNALSAIGIPKTHLFVHDDNINAQQFYEKLGWFPRNELRLYSYNSSDNRNS